MLHAKTERLDNTYPKTKFISRKYVHYTGVCFCTIT